MPRNFLVLLATLAVGCSSSKRSETEPATTPATTLSAGSARTPGTSGQAEVPTAGVAQTAAPLEVAGLSFVEIPALRPPKGIRRIIGLNTEYGTAALSPAGDVVALAGGLNGVQLLHLPTGRGLAARTDLACVEPKPDTIGDCEPRLAFSPDGKHLAVWWPLDHKLLKLAVPSGKTELEAKVEDVIALSFLPDGRLAALRNEVSYVFDTAGARSNLIVAKGFATRLSPDGRQVVIDSDAPHIVDVATGRVATEPPGGVAIDDVEWGPDGKTWVATTKAEWRDVVTWRAGERAPRTLADSKAARATAGGNGIWGFAFPAPYDQVYVGMSDGIAGFSLDGKPGFRSEWLTSIALKPGSIARTSDGIVLLTGNCPLRLDAHGQPIPGPGLCALRPAHLAFDGDKLVSIPWGGLEVMTFDTKTGALVAAQRIADPYPSTSATLAAIVRDPALAAKVHKAFALPNVKAGNYQLSRDGRRLFVQGIDNPRDAAIIDLTKNTARTGMLAFTASADGSRIAQQRLDREDLVDVRSVNGDKLIKSITVQGRLIGRMALSDDGKLLVTEGDSKLEVLDVASGRMLFEPPCRGTYTGSFAISVDGSLLVCDTTSAVEVYNLRTRKRIKRVEHPREESVDSVALSSDNKRLAIGIGDIWIVDL